MMQDYSKVPLTYAEQISLLQSRGLIIADTATAGKFLEQVNYYRFSAYCVPFQNPRDAFIPGTSFEMITALYRLDEELRNAFMALISPVEIFLRTHIVYELSHTCGVYCHYESSNFRPDFEHAQWMASLDEEVTRGKETFLDHFKTKYNGFPRLPIWVACEVMSMGTLSLLYSGLCPDLQRRIRLDLEIHHFTLAKWMHVITYLRNLCAHHNRLWNRELAIRPTLPNKDPRWTGLALNNEHILSIVALLEWICRRADISLTFVDDVYAVMRSISAIDTRFSAMMGVPAGRAIGMCWETGA